MSDLKRSLGEAVAAAFAAQGLPAELGRVTASDRPDLADFQCNGALPAAKVAGKRRARSPPRWSRPCRVTPAAVCGDRRARLHQSARQRQGPVRPGARDFRRSPHRRREVAEARRIMVDYGGPNVAKPMHVGHLRASIIGESVKRIYRFRGDEVLGDAHFGDWGFQMGLLIVAVCDEDPFVRALMERLGDTPRDVSVADERQVMEALGDHIDLPMLDRLYPEAAGRAKTDADYRDRARRATAELQGGRVGYRMLWKHFVKVSRVALEREFHALGIDFDLWKGESDVDPLIEPMVRELETKGLLADDQAPGSSIWRGRARRRRRRPPTGRSTRRPAPIPCWWSLRKARRCTARPTWLPCWTGAGRSTRTWFSIASTSARPTISSRCSAPAIWPATPAKARWNTSALAP